MLLTACMRAPCRLTWELAGRQGFEPRYRGPEPRVLPLDDLPVPAAARPSTETSQYSQSKTGPASAAAGTDWSLEQRARVQRICSLPIICSPPPEFESVSAG